MTLSEKTTLYCVVRDFVEPIIRDAVSETITGKIQTTQPAKRFVDEMTARLRFGGGEKPIAKTTLYSICEKHNLTKYSPTPGRVLYDINEIDRIIEQSAS